MAKADRGYRCFAATTMRRQAEDLERELRGAAEEDDIEFVHRSRVASRRLRASLRTFYDCLPKDERKEWTRTVKGVTRSLGEARDLDVQIEFLSSYISKQDGDASLHRLLATLSGRRREAQARVDHAVKDVVEGDALRSIRIWCDQLVDGEDDPETIRRKALICAMSGIDSLFLYDRYVTDPSAVLKHHEMRIAGKRLRYTLEIFSEAFDVGLKPFIKRLKEMQDVLGEMHDCDVWTSMLARRKGDGAARLRADRSARRSSLHGEFTDIWARIKDDMVPELEATMRGHREVDRYSSYEGRVAIISDVHGNLPALQAVLRDAEEAGAGAILNAGDSVGPAPFNPEVVAELAGRDMISVIGNFDREMIAVRGRGPDAIMVVPSSKREMTRKIIGQLGQAECDWLLSLPERAAMTVCGKRVLMVHASPASREEKVIPETPKERMSELASMVKADIVITGHSHIQLDREEAGVRFINPGSVGRQSDGDPRASYALWDPREGIVMMRRVAYPIHDLLDAFVDNNWSSKDATMYISGSTDRGIDDNRESLEPTIMVGMAEELAREHGHLDAHSIHVRDLALRIFHDIGSEIGLRPEDEVLLQCAATVHDIGWSWGGKGHNRSSFDLVLMSKTLGVPLVDKLIIANICRYHNGKGPRRSHGNLILLSPEQIKKVERLASVLRIADGLDYGHSQSSRISSVRMTQKELRIKLEDVSGCSDEIRSALEKSDLFIDLTGRSVSIG